MAQLAEVIAARTYFADTSGFACEQQGTGIIFSVASFFALRAKNERIRSNCQYAICNGVQRMPEQQISIHTPSRGAGHHRRGRSDAGTAEADTAIWRVAHGQQLYALRVFRAEQAETCRREIAAMRAALAGGLPIPAIHAGRQLARSAGAAAELVRRRAAAARAATPTRTALEPRHAVWAHAGGDSRYHACAGP